MTKRPPEMVELESYCLAVNPVTKSESLILSSECPDYVCGYQAVDAIRSLRVKLFRERARWHVLKTDGPDFGRHMRAAGRFSRISDAIERGEK